jgi:hypothetical protein
MVAHDPRRWPPGDKRLSDQTIAALRDAIAAQKQLGATPSTQLEAAIQAAARDARERGINPEVLLVQLKLIAEEAGVNPVLGESGAGALREWLVTACVAAYYRN